MPVQTPVEMRFDIPVMVGGKLGAEVICKGEIVRTVLPASTDDRACLAAKILHYRLERRRARPSQVVRANLTRASPPEAGRAPPGDVPRDTKRKPINSTPGKEQ